MTKIRYRCEAGTTHRAGKRFHHIHRLGRILEVRGYRFVSTRHTSEGTPYTTDHERVLVRGVNGTARFSGLCWGYKGEGPHGLIRLLLECGLAFEIAEEIAFCSPRTRQPGTDWKVEFKLSIDIHYSSVTLGKHVIGIGRKDAAA